MASNGTLTSAERTALQTAADAMATDLVALSYVESLTLFHNSAPFAPSDINSLAVQQQIATQRRRMRR